VDRISVSPQGLAGRDFSKQIDKSRRAGPIATERPVPANTAIEKPQMPQTPAFMTASGSSARGTFEGDFEARDEIADGFSTVILGNADRRAVRGERAALESSGDREGPGVSRPVARVPQTRTVAVQSGGEQWRGPSGREFDRSHRGGVAERFVERAEGGRVPT